MRKDLQATNQELEKEAKRIAELMCAQGLSDWMVEEVVERETIPMYRDRLIPMVKDMLRGLY